jgi:glycosyltransferase involved in cell wall biosynthesis
MKIALPAPSAIPARRANTIQVMKMAEALVGLGHAVRVYSPPGPPVTVAELSIHYGLGELPDGALSVEWLAAAPSLRRYDFSVRAVRRARAWAADLVYTRLPQAAALAAWRGLTTVFELHDDPPGRMGPLLLRLYLRAPTRKRLVVITHALAERVCARFSLPWPLVLPDAVDLRRYRGLPAPGQARRELGLPGLDPERFTLGYTGHLYPGRGAELLLPLAERLPEVTLLLVGGEPADVERVRAEAAREGLGNLLLTGFVPNADLPRYQAACDLLLAPYGRRVAASSGGDIAAYLSPMKLFEYLACGRPILAGDLAALGEILKDDYAVRLPPDDPDAWAAAVRRLMADPDHRQRMAAAARTAAEQHTWEQRARSLLEGM